MCVCSFSNFAWIHNGRVFLYYDYYFPVAAGDMLVEEVRSVSHNYYDF